MSREKALYRIHQLVIRYRRLRWSEVIVISFAGAILGFAFLQLFNVTPYLKVTIAIIILIAILLARSFHLRISQFNESSAAKHLNSIYSDLEESSDLILLQEGSLPLIQQIQQAKVIRQLENLDDDIKFPNKLKYSVIAFAGSLIILLLVALFPYHHQENKKSLVQVAKKAIDTKIRSASLANSDITIIAPRYTNLPIVKTNNLNLKLLEGSEVIWLVNLKGRPVAVYIIFSGKDTIQMTALENSWTLKNNFIESGFYQIEWIDKNHERKNSDFFKIEIIKDQPPKIIVETPMQRTEVKYSKSMTVNLKVGLSDDYGLSDAFIIATVTKGSGESVKFREEKLRFTKPIIIQRKKLTTERILNLNQLGMEPGDELYFYVEALDTKLPIAGSIKTETFFISIQDTTKETTGFASEMGVDIMPEYFRSERQIIIDSEKLLEDQKNKKISQRDFNSKSNDVAADQKSLRLRYGQFMGEEAESGMKAEPESNHEDEDVTKKYGHVHDAEKESTTLPSKTTTENSKTTKETSLKDFVHDHDNGDEATFFEQSVKEKLKAALALMWDAELHLRLNDPAHSLPFQYRILKLLKEISNDSRVYVHRTGIDAPPIKEEKRLTGDLSEIKNSVSKTKVDAAVQYTAIKKAAAVLETFIMRPDRTLSPSQKELFRQSAGELAATMLENPTLDLKSLTYLKTFINNDLPIVSKRSTLLQIRKAFWQVIPPEISSPTQSQKTLHAMDQSFLKNMEGSKK